MTQRAARVVCPRCGANNFDTVSACWKCQSPLVGAVSSGMPQTGMSPPLPSPGALDRGVLPAPVYSAPLSTGDSGVARRAAIALGITLPFIGLPVGWVFMMIEDERKQAIGRLCAIWSMISLVLQLLLMFVAAQTLAPMLQGALSLAAKTAQQAEQQSQSRDMGGGIP